MEGQVIENAVQETVQETVDKVNSNWDQIKAYFNGHIPDLISFGMKVVLSIVAFYVGTKLIKWLLKVAKRSMEKAGIDMGVAQFICSFGKFLLYLILIFNIATNFGVKESSVAALLGTAGVTIGLALQGGLENLSGGVMLLLFKPFQVGDYIIQDQAGGTEGTVYKVEMFYTTLITIDNKHVIIPNGKLSNSTIINVTAQNLRNLEIKVEISYDSDIKKAKKLLQHILQEDPGTKSDKDMLVFVDELADSAVVMGLRVWVPTDKYWNHRARRAARSGAAHRAGVPAVPEKGHPRSRERTACGKHRARKAAALSGRDDKPYTGPGRERLRPSRNASANRRARSDGSARNGRDGGRKGTAQRYAGRPARHGRAGHRLAAAHHTNRTEPCAGR